MQLPAVVMQAGLQLMVVVPFIIPVFLPLGFGFFWVRRRYLATSREVKRFEAISRSPVYASFSAVLKVHINARYRVPTCTGALICLQQVERAVGGIVALGWVGSINGGHANTAYTTMLYYLQV